MRKIYLILSFCSYLFAQNLDIDFYSLIHVERENMLGKDNNTSYPNESNSFATIYSSLELNYNITDDIFISSMVKANYVASEDNYKTPAYLRAKLTSKDINRIIVGELSLNYDDGFYSLNIGRNEIDYDWIDGSMDGVVGMLGDDDNYSLRLFWLQNFTQLHYNYYVKFKDINNKEGIYGAITNLKKDFMELSIFDYYIPSLRNIIGGHVNFLSDSMALNIGHTEAKPLSLALYDYHESFSDISFEYLYKKHYFEIGASLTGENGLLAMVQLGSFMFGAFYLSNQVDRENAKNAYLHYIYFQDKWQFEILGGLTKYDNSYEVIANDLDSKEVDIYLNYKFSKNLSFDIGAMWMDVDTLDPISISQTLVMTNMVYRYESF